MSWYRGPSVLEHLESIRVPGQVGQPFRMPVQLVLREGGVRAYGGIVASGSVAAGDEVLVARSGRRTRVTGFAERDGQRERAVSGDSVAFVLADELDIGRGDLLASPQTAPQFADQFAAHILWFDDKELFPERGYLLKAGAVLVPASVTAVRHRIDPDDLSERAARTLAMNEIGHCHIMTATPVAFDPYRENRETGGFILIDRDTKMTVGAGLIEHVLDRASNVHAQAFEIGRAARARAKGQTPCVVWFTGLPGSGKSTIANEVERRLHAAGFHTYILDGDNLRRGLTKDLGFTEIDRVENVRRAAEVAALMADAGLIVLCCFVSPFAAERRAIRERIGGETFLEAFVDTPLEVCIARDPKGLYAKSRSGEARNVTGIDQRYEAPEAPELRLRTAEHSAEELADSVLDALRERGFLERS